ncbi:MAG: hypothetical protein PHI88_00105 [Candidatus Pacebacteria bacterium]|nr:hypothetical protein [Candidatus Paceibacterota bacterium]
MKKRNKIIFALSILFVFALFFIFNLSFAADWGGWEVTYPWNPPEPNLPEYIKYVYQFSFWVGAFLAVIMIIIGGIEWSGAAANPQLKAAARDKITRSIIGLLALFSIYIVLRTINPDLVRLKDVVIKEPTLSNAGEEDKIKKDLMAGNFIYTANGIAIANSIMLGKLGSMGNSFDLPVNSSGAYAKLLTRALCSPPDADEFKNFKCTEGLPLETCECQGREGGLSNSCGNFCMGLCQKYHKDNKNVYGVIAPKDRALGGLPSECTKLNHVDGGDPVACSCYQAHEDSFSSVQTFQLSASGKNPAFCLCKNDGTTAAYFKGQNNLENIPECRSGNHDFCMDYCKRLEGYKFGYTSACEAEYAYEKGYYTAPDHLDIMPRCTCIK